MRQQKHTKMLRVDVQETTSILIFGVLPAGRASFGFFSIPR